MAKNYKKTSQKSLSRSQMSKLHWKLRSKGKTYIEALKITGKAKELSKKLMNNSWKKGKFKKYWNLDFDGDGKVNKYDCYPFDKKRQDHPKWELEEERKISNYDKKIKGIGETEYEKRQIWQDNEDFKTLHEIKQNKAEEDYNNFIKERMKDPTINADTYKPKINDPLKESKTTSYKLKKYGLT